jgi:ABC-type transport system involved in multi-copper enzyme maturation permease subunit
MINLVRKDILAQKHYLWFALAYSIFIFMAFSKSEFSPFIYIMGAVAIAYVMILGAIQTEFKNNSDIVLLSLPLKREEVVVSKYLAIFIFSFIALVFMAAVGFVMNLTPLPWEVRLIRWQDVVITLISVMLMSAVYFPVYYKIEGKWVQVINIVVFMVLFFAPANIFSLLSDNQHSNWVNGLFQIAGQNPLVLPSIGIVAALLLLVVSLLISLRIYQRKDF